MRKLIILLFPTFLLCHSMPTYADSPERKKEKLYYGMTKIQLQTKSTFHFSKPQEEGLIGNALFISKEGHFITLRSNLVSWMKATHLYEIKLKNSDGRTIEPLHLGNCQDFPQGVPSVCYLKSRYGPYQWYELAQSDRIQNDIHFLSPNEKKFKAKLLNQLQSQGQEFWRLKTQDNIPEAGLPLVEKRSEKNSPPLLHGISVQEKKDEPLVIPASSILSLINETKSFTKMTSDYRKDILKKMMWPKASHLTKKQQEKAAKEFHKKSKKLADKTLKKLKKFFKKHDKDLNPKLKSQIASFMTRNSKKNPQSKRELKKMLKKEGFPVKDQKKSAREEARNHNKGVGPSPSQRLWDMAKEMQKTQIPPQKHASKSEKAQRLLKNTEHKTKLIKGLVQQEKHQLQKHKFEKKSGKSAQKKGKKQATGSVPTKKAQGKGPQERKKNFSQSIHFLEQNLEEVKKEATNFLGDAI